MHACTRTHACTHTHTCMHTHTHTHTHMHAHTHTHTLTHTHTHLSFCAHCACVCVRFVSDGMWMQKKTTYVDFPIADLDLEDVTLGPTQRARYSLYGVSVSHRSLEEKRNAPTSKTRTTKNIPMSSKINKSRKTWLLPFLSIPKLEMPDTTFRSALPSGMYEYPGLHGGGCFLLMWGFFFRSSHIVDLIRFCVFSFLWLLACFCIKLCTE